MNAVDITYPVGSYNAGGISQVVWAFAEDIAAFPVLDMPGDADATLETLVKTSTPVVMKAGKSFKKLYCTPETGELRSSPVGERDGKGFENFLEIGFPGNTPEFLGFMALVANSPVVFGVLEKNKTVRLLGSPQDPAGLDTGDGTSGKAIADARRTSPVFKASGNTPPPIYHLGIETLLVPGEQIP